MATSYLSGTYLTGAGYSFYSTVCPGIPHPSHRCTSDNNNYQKQTALSGALNRAMPRHERGRLFRIRFDNLACDCVDQLHSVFFAVTNQSFTERCRTTQIG